MIRPVPFSPAKAGRHRYLLTADCSSLIPLIMRAQIEAGA